MKKLTPKQLFDLIDYLSDCEDDYSLNAINYTLKILDYSNTLGYFSYDFENDCIKCDGGLEHQESE